MAREWWASSRVATSIPSEWRSCFRFRRRRAHEGAVRERGGSPGAVADGRLRRADARRAIRALARRGGDAAPLQGYAARRHGPARIDAGLSRRPAELRTQGGERD